MAKTAMLMGSRALTHSVAAIGKALVIQYSLEKLLLQFDLGFELLLKDPVIDISDEIRSH